jgi:hypothetical protein
MVPLSGGSEDEVGDMKDRQPQSVRMTPFWISTNINYERSANIFGEDMLGPHEEAVQGLLDRTEWGPQPYIVWSLYFARSCRRRLGQ